MRVTQKMISNSMQYAFQKNLSGISKTQEQISLGTKINRPSDDPAGFSQTMALQSNLSLNKQYQRNITDGLGWLEQTDVGLNNATVIMQTAREKANQGANDTLTRDDRIAVAKQIDAMTDEMVEVANTSLGGKYIFAGLKNTATPFHRSGDDFTFTGDDSDVLREIAPDGRYEVNINGKKFFFDKIVDVAKGAGSMVDTVDITSEQDIVKSFGAITDADLTTTPLNGKLVLNIDGNDYDISFSGESTVAAMLAKINSALGVNGSAAMDTDSNLVLSSNSTNPGTYIKVKSIDDNLSGLKLLAGFNGLQFGKYKVSTVDGASPGDSTAVVTDYYSQAGNTIVGNVGVVSASNTFNSSILMEVTKVNYTQDHAEIISSAALAIPPGVLPDGSKLGLKIDGVDYMVNFSGVTSNNDVVSQINKVLGTAGEAYLDGGNNLVLRSNSTGQDSKIQVTQIDDPAVLNLALNQSGGVGVADAAVRFTYHTYDKDGNRYDGCVEQVFTDTDPKDGIPDTPAHLIIGDGSGTHDIDLNISLTRFVEAGDKAVISVAAQTVAGDDSIGINYDGKDRKWVFNDNAVDSGAKLKFFTLDEGNGEFYDGNVDLTFNGSISDSTDAATFTAGNIFDSLVYLRKKLENNQTAKISQCLEYLDEKMGWLLQERVRVGARTNHLESVDEHYSNLEVNINDMMDGYYSTDVAKATVELNEKQLTYQASLAAGARIMQTNLLDYLK
ncbi:MAG: Flagellar hook-associated protein 3 [Pelotomaculum sp. PtaB.Bin104]|nr:MAG: Flagellar hook-associated protein 3 [Pelotomaculum sp. PtaB.Bin104]